MKDRNFDLEETSSKLADGLKSCRTVVNNYRSLLTTDLGGEGSGDEAVIPFGETEPSIENPDPLVSGSDNANAVQG